MKKMNLLKKSVYAATATAFCAVLGFGIDASAASVTYDYNTDKPTEISVTPGSGDTEVFVGYGTAKNSILTIKDADWDVYDAPTTSGAAVKVDLSHIKSSNDSYIQFKGNVNDEPVTIKVNASNQKLKMDKLAFAEDKDAGETVTLKAKSGYTKDKDDLEYRVGTNGAWSSDITLDEPTDAFDEFLNRGATAYFRPAGDNPGLDKDEKLYVDKAKTEAKAVTVTDSITLPGKECKVSIPKRKNGPKLAADYVKGTVTVPKNAMIRLLTQENEYVPNEWKEASEQKKVTEVAYDSTTKIPVGGDKTNYVEVVTKAAKNSRSKITSLKLDAVSALSLKSGDSAVDGADITINTGTSLKVNDKVEVKGTTLEADPKNAGSYKGDIEITNGDTATYDYAISSSNTAVATTDKYKSVKAGKTAKIKAASNDNKYLWVRKAGNKSTKEWASQPVLVGKISKTIVAASGNTPAATLTVKNGDTTLATNGEFTIAGKNGSVTLNCTNIVGRMTAELKDNANGAYSMTSTANTVTVTADNAGSTDVGSLEIKDGKTTYTLAVKCDGART
jgi:hypothetical protein